MKQNLKDLLSFCSKEIIEKSCLKKNGRLSPFLNKPYQYLHPGMNSEMLFKLHEIYPEVFSRETGFMGIKGSSKWTKKGREHLAWKLAKNKIMQQEGYIDSQGNFRAPIICYSIKDGNTPFSDKYVLFQQGSYQILPGSSSNQVENGEVLIHRGIGKRENFVPPQIKEENKEKYMEYLSWSFLSSVNSLKYNQCYRGETNHIESINLPEIFFDFQGGSLEQSFTIWEDMAKRKFGPNYVTYKTPLDNIRLLTKWCGEGEVFLLDPERAERIK